MKKLTEKNWWDYVVFSTAKKRGDNISVVKEIYGGAQLKCLNSCKWTKKNFGERVNFGTWGME